jgi:Fe-S oxidoreductase/nitrate reductase gamma subunit
LEFPHFFLTEDLHLIILIFFFIIIFILTYGILNISKKIFNNFKEILEILKSLNKNSFKNFITYWLFQKKVIGTTRGKFHLLIYIGIIILFFGTVIRAFDYYFYKGLVSGTSYVIFKLFMNVGGLMVLIGILVLLTIRLKLKPRELTYTWVDWLFLLGLLYMIVTGFILSGIVTIMINRPVWVDPIGYLFGILINSLIIPDIETLYRILWLSHFFLAQFLIALIPWTKIGHWFYSFFNIIFARKEVSSLKPIPNINEIVEKGENFGVIKLEDFSWKQKLDFLSCTFCGRCETKCPAFNSGKPLSPAKLIQNLRYALIKGREDNIVPNTINPDIIWSCTACGACVFECPVLIHQVETIMDLRRGLVSRSENVPEQALATLNNVMRSGNTFGLSYYDRDEWINSLIEKYGIEYAEEGKEYDYIYWLGCNISFDPSQRQNAEALIYILRKMNFKVAILREEMCCGEPIRKIGDEFTFQNNAKQIFDLLTKCKFKSLLVSCPHGYNTFKNDYSTLGYKLDVKHYVQVLYELIQEGKIKINKKLKEKLTYHDPCNLARWNNIYEEPRRVIEKFAENFEEMKRIKTNTFCCGAGGAQLFYQINIGERISKIRAKEASETGAKTLVVACPFCYSMLKGDAEELGLEIKDLAKLVAENME